MANDSEARNAPPPAGRLDPAQWRAILAHSPLLFDVLSNSMFPTFRAGERVLIRAPQAGEPRRGQVAVYCRAALVTHRYLGDGISRGDGLLDHDPPVAPEEIIGIVTGVERAGRIVPIGHSLPFATRVHRLRLYARHALGRLRKTL